MTASLSAAAFNFFHIPPVGRFTIADARNWVALAAFFVRRRSPARSRSSPGLGPRGGAAAPGGRPDGRARPDPARPTQRRAALPVAASGSRRALELPSAALSSARPPEHRRGSRCRSRRRETRSARWWSRRLDPETLSAAGAVVPGLEALLAAAIEREARRGRRSRRRRCGAATSSRPRCSARSRTTCARRSPRSGRRPRRSARPTITEEDRAGARRRDRRGRRRLAALVDNLLDLSRLQAGTRRAPPDWGSIEEVLEAALDDLALTATGFRLSIDEQPAVRPRRRRPARARVREPARERGPLLRRPAGLGPRPRVVGGRLVSASSTAGPGIPERSWSGSSSRSTAATRTRRPSGCRARPGDRQGLRRGQRRPDLRSSRCPGQGTSFVVEFPLGARRRSSSPPASAAPTGR